MNMEEEFANKKKVSDFVLNSIAQHEKMDKSVLIVRLAIQDVVINDLGTEAGMTQEGFEHILGRAGKIVREVLEEATKAIQVNS